ncbi:MAG: hypothetical protein ACU0CA_14315 [Paracoccaceae bacterium]
MKNSINRRTALQAIGAAPIVALPAVAMSASPEQTDIQRLYVDWRDLTKDYFAVDARYDRGEIDDTRFEQLANPILEQRFGFEDQIAALDGQSLEDLAIKAIISAHYAWSDAEMQKSLSADAVRFLKAPG